MSRTCIFPFRCENHLHYRFLFKFFLLHHIHVCCPKISFREHLSFNTFSRTFVHFTILISTCYDFTSYSIVLHTSISAWVFQSGIFFSGVLFMSPLK